MSINHSIVSLIVPFIQPLWLSVHGSIAIFRWVNLPLLELRLHIFIHPLRWWYCANLYHFALLTIVINNRHACLYKCLEPLLYTRFVIINASRGLATVQQTLSHHFFWAVKEEGKFGGADGFFE